MIKIENVKVTGFEAAIRGMRNPMNSWEKSDSVFYYNDTAELYTKTLNMIGAKDMELALKLASAGSVHGKFRRMIVVYADITAPLYWWKEFDTYKVGTVANSCSTMHKIHAKEFWWDDFSTEHLDYYLEGCRIKLDGIEQEITPPEALRIVIAMLNAARKKFIETGNKDYWWQMIQLLPSSYNQRRTVMLNYEVLSSIYIYRNNHKLDEWINFCEWITELPYREIITCTKEGK